MEHNYCRRCGSKITSTDNAKFTCEQGHHHFGGPIPGACVFIVDDKKQNVLMTRRGINPGKGMLGTLGGFSNVGETAEQTAVREVEEESSLTPVDYQPLQYLCTATNTYEYQGEERPVLSVAFWTELKPSHADIQPNDDASEIVSLPIADIDPEQIYGDDTKTGLYQLKIRLGL